MAKVEEYAPGVSGMSMRQISGVSMVDLAKSTFTPEKSSTSGR